jgi:hypothetical protein
LEYEYTLEKADEVIKKGQSRDTGNVGNTRHRTKTNKTKNPTQKTKKMSNKDKGHNCILLSEFKSLAILKSR